MKVPFNKPYLAGRELEYIAQAVQENLHTSGNGPFTEQCHQWLEETLGCHRALLTHSCTAALEISAILADVGPGDEVIMPSFTFVSTANAFALRGATPVFVDIDPETLNIDVACVARAVTERTKALVPVHYAGVPCDMDALGAVATDHGLMVIEDAAQGMFSTYKGKYLGTIGDLGCLSFHETKNIISGEGGALLVNEQALVDRAEVLRDRGTNRRSFLKGMVEKYTWVDLGSSFFPSDIIAAFLYAQMERSQEISAWRSKVFSLYLEALAPLEAAGLLRLSRLMEGGNCNGHIFYILTASQQERGEMIAHLARQGVDSVFHYVPLHSSPGGRVLGRSEGSMAVTDDLSARLLRLPMFFEITAQDVAYVAQAVRSFYGK